MKNLVKTKNAQLGVALPVPAYAAPGQVVPLGTGGLSAILITTRATSATIAAGTSAPGVRDGEATVELVGVSLITRQNAPAVAQYVPLFVDNAGALTLTAAGNIKVGYALDTTQAPGPVRVAHVG